MSDQSDVRILVLSDAIPNRNGVGTYYEDLLEQLEQRLGHAEMIPATANSIFKQKRVRMRLPGDGTQTLHFPNVRAIFRRIREVNPQLILTPSVGPFAVLSWCLTRGRKRALVVGYHTSFDQLSKMYWKGSKRRLFRSYLVGWSKRLVRGADLVLVNSREMEAEARRLGGRRVICIGTTLARPFLRDVTPHSGSVRRVFFAGRFAAEKNIHSILDAASLHRDLEFRLAGDGPSRGEIEKQARDLDNVTLLGWLGREEVLDQIDDCDVLVLPSHVESFGSIALEAMARGRLVIVSKACGIAQWPSLAQYLNLINKEEKLGEVLTRLRGRSPEELREKARGSVTAAREMHDATLSHWLEQLSGCLQNPDN